MPTVRPKLLDPGDPRAPKYWRYETTGILAPVVEAYLEGKTLNGRQVGLMRAYLYQWVASPVWAESGELEALRLRVAAIKTTDDVRGAIHAGLALGMDPL